MAERLADGDEQRLQQFVSQSPWRWEIVRANVAGRMVAEIEPDTWIVDDTGFAKKGRWSVAVARQYSGALGRADNCQIGVSISAATDRASCPINWRLFVPAEWDRRYHGVSLWFPYIVQVKAGTSAYLPGVEAQLRPWNGRGRPPVARYHAAPSSLRELVLGAAEQAITVSWRHGSRGPMRSRFVALRVRPANIQH